MPLAWHPYLRPAQAERDHLDAAARDPRGDRYHLVAALLWCALCSAPTSVLEFAGLPLAVLFVLRFPKIWRSMGSALVQPAMLALLGFIAWHAISLAWSPDPAQGRDELARHRWIWAAWFLWPVVRYRPWLIAAIAAGALAGNLVQLLHALDVRLGLGLLPFARFADRISGWWDPVAGGSLLVAMLGLHLPAIVLGRGRWRALAIAGAAITLVGIVATGSRGAWLAAAALTLVAPALAWLVARAWATREAAAGSPALREHARLGAHRARRALAPLVAGALVLAVAVAALALTREGVRTRLDQARRDLLAARAGNYHTDTGARLLMARLAIDAVRAHPVRGVGAGGYGPWSIAHLRATEGDAVADAAPVHAHAHNAPLHVAATTGLVGLALAGAAAGLALAGGLARPGTPPADPLARAVTLSPPMALLGFGLVSAFDVVHLNTQTAAVLFTLLPMCFVSRPPETTAWPRDNEPRPPTPG